jgi:hypothetical protein
LITTSETSSTFTIRDIPLGRLGLAAVAFVLSVPLGIFLIVKLPFPPPSKSLPLVLVDLYGFGYGIVCLFMAKYRVTTIDRNIGTIALSIRGLLGFKYLTFRFSEVAKSFGGLRVNTDYRVRQYTRGVREYKVYGVQLPLASGDDLDLTGYAWFQRNGCNMAVERANKYINNTI